MNVPPDVSIIVVSWNTESLVDECLASIEQQMPEDAFYETIVVDNASSDGTVELVKAKYPKATLIANDENLGFATACNQAARRAVGRYFLLLNSDASLRDGNVRKLVDMMDKDESIGVISGALMGSSGRVSVPCKSFPRPVELILGYSINLIYRKPKKSNNNRNARSIKRDVNGTKIYEADWVPGCFVLVRGSLMDDNNLLEDDIFMYYEDALLCCKAWGKGLRVLAVEFTVADHVSGASSRQVSVTATRYSYESSLVYVKAMFGDKTLKWYQRVNRGIWRVMFSALTALNYLGITERADEKRKIFRSLLAVPQRS
ncbi:MAG: glycosyltransferase family 2 protein [Pseudomonadota bacterium]